MANLRFLLGRAYMGGEFIDLDEAIWLFTQVLNVQPQSVEVLNSRAVAFLDRGRPGDFDLAIDDLLRAASIKPDRAATSLNLAVAYLDRGGQGDAERALASLDAALAAEPDYAAALVNRAGAYVARGASGDLDRAFDDLDKALGDRAGLGLGASQPGDRLPGARLGRRSGTGYRRAGERDYAGPRAHRRRTSIVVLSIRS